MKRSTHTPTKSRFPHRITAVVNDLIAGIDVAFISQNDTHAIVECLKERRSESMIYNNVRERRRIDQVLKRFENAASNSPQGSPKRGEALLTGLLTHRIKVSEVSPEELNSTQDACTRARTTSLNRANFAKVRELDNLLDEIVGASRTTEDEKDKFVMSDNSDALWSQYETLRDRRNSLNEEWHNERLKLDEQRDEGVKAIKASYEGKGEDDIMMQFRPSRAIMELKLAYREMMAAQQYEDAKRTGQKMQRLEEQEVKDFKRRHEIAARHKRSKVAKQMNEKIQECNNYWKDRKDELEPRYVFQIDKIETRMHMISRRLYRLGYVIKDEIELVQREDYEEEDAAEEKKDEMVSVHSIVTFKTGTSSKKRVQEIDKSLQSESYNSSQETLSD